MNNHISYSNNGTTATRERIIYLYPACHHRYFISYLTFKLAFQGETQNPMFEKILFFSNIFFFFIEEYFDKKIRLLSSFKNFQLSFIMVV